MALTTAAHVIAVIASTRTRRTHARVEFIVHATHDGFELLHQLTRVLSGRQVVLGAAMTSNRRLTHGRTLRIWNACVKGLSR